MEKMNMIDITQNGLVYSTSYSENAELFTTNLVIAKYAGINVRSVNRVINKYIDEIVEKFGKVRFKITPSNKNGSHQKTKIFELTEDQATFIFTLLRNTKQVVEFKARLVKAFSKAKRLLNKRLLEHEVSKPISKLLAEAISNNPNLDNKAYIYVNNLIYKVALGKPLKKIREERKATNQVDTNRFLIGDERDRINNIKHVVIGLLGMNLTYDEIKSRLSSF